jgi:hypothetical protein
MVMYKRRDAVRDNARINGFLDMKLAPIAAFDFDGGGRG